jgi:hypothetical protein
MPVHKISAQSLKIIKMMAKHMPSNIDIKKDPTNLQGLFGKVNSDDTKQDRVNRFLKYDGQRKKKELEANMTFEERLELAKDNLERAD